MAYIWRKAAFALTLTSALLAYVSSGSAAPHRGLSLTVREGGSQKTIPLYSRSFALVIGNDAYEDDAWVRLSGAVKDAEAVAEALTQQGFEVTLLTNLTGRELKYELEKFIIYQGNEEKDSRLFVWYAGHGHTMNGEGYLVPVDAPNPDKNLADFRFKALSMRRFGEFMRQTNSRHVLSVFDSCFSGTIFETARSKPPEVVDRAVSHTVRQFVSSGDANQTVSDNGRFRQLFIEAITGQDKRADRNRDGYILGSELGLYLQERMTAYTENGQTPRWGKLTAHGYDRGDFVFQLPRTTPTKPETQQSQEPLSNADRIALLERLLLERQSGSNTNMLKQGIWDKDLVQFKRLRREERLGKASAEQVEKAGRFLRKAEAEDNAEARYQLAFCYEEGKCGVTKDRKEALRLYRLAADQKHKDATARLAIFHLFGVAGVTKDPAKALTLVQPLSDRGHALSRAILGLIYETGSTDLGKDPKEALRLYRLAADQDYGWASQRIAHFYLKGTAGLQPDEASALKHARDAAEQGNMLGQYMLAQFHEMGKGGLQPDRERALSYYRLAANQDHSQARKAIERLAARQNPPPEKPQSAENSQKQDNDVPSRSEPYALYQEALCFSKGLCGQPQDRQKAAKLFRQAADMGVGAAMHELANYWAKGWGGLEPNASRAIEYYQKAGNTGTMPQSYAAIGLLYLKGTGNVRKSYEKAFRYFKLAADGGHIPANVPLGYLHQKGLGISRDLREAHRYYGIAADKGYAAAQFNYAVAWESGYGGRKDYDEAARYLLKSLKQGYARAWTYLVEKPTTFSIQTRRAVQYQLQQGGYYSGRIDGEIGANSRRALEAFRQASN